MERQYERKEIVFLCSVCLENKSGNYFSGTCKDCLKKQTMEDKIDKSKCGSKTQRKCKLMASVRDHCTRYCLFIPHGTQYCYQDTCPLYPYKDKADR